jgi:hypothetical protein
MSTKNKTDIFRQPGKIFFVYMLVSCIGILIFRSIYPGEPSPLPVFSKNWNLIRGLLDIVALFPALAFSAFVIPFGWVLDDEPRYQRFSPQLFQRLTSSIVTVICAAALYALLCFVVLPLARNAEGNMRFRGEEYRLAKERALSHVRDGEWLEASRFIGICEALWVNSPELEGVRNQVEIQVEALRMAEVDARAARTADVRSAGLSALPGQNDPVDAAEAIAMARKAFDERKYIDSHWYATLAGRLARVGSPEGAESARLAALAWNEVESQRPGPRETAAFLRYQLKASGYQAVLAGDWIRAYYIFKELDETSTGAFDPDVENFLALSEKGTKEIAFFIDEEELSVGGTLTGVVFSLPRQAEGSSQRPQGRAVLRIAGFSSAPDYAYGIGLEYMVFDSLSRPLLNLQAPYAKFLPITLEGQQRVLVLMRALDRSDPNIRREPTFTATDESVYKPDQAQVILNVSFETFLMLSRMRQGLPGFQFRELFDAGRIAGDYGYISQVFEAEVLNRLGSCLFFLPMSIIVVLLGMRLRARTRSRYISVLMLPVLPVVFNGLTHLYRTVFNTAGISLVLEVGFSTALTIFIVFLVFFFILSLIFLAAHRD